jgi:hypothetical protein
VLEAAGRIELATLEVFDEGVAEDAVPSIEISQLLRSLPQLGEEAADAEKGAAGALMLAVRAGHGDRGLPGMLGLPADRLEQQRPAGSRFKPSQVSDPSRCPRPCRTGLIEELRFDERLSTLAAGSVLLNAAQ